MTALDAAGVVSPMTVVGDGVDLTDARQVDPFCVIGVDGGDRSAPVFGAGLIVRSHTVVYRGVRAGRKLHLGHGVLVREDAELGDDVSIGSHSVVEHHVVLGDGVRLHTGCFVPEFSVLEAGAWLGPGVTVTNARYPNRADTKDHLTGVHLEAGATVGAAAVLLPGVRIGAGALVGAGAVVTADVEPGATVVGNPGRALPSRA